MNRSVKCCNKNARKLGCLSNHAVLSEECINKISKLPTQFLLILNI